MNGVLLQALVAGLLPGSLSGAREHSLYDTVLAKPIEVKGLRVRFNIYPSRGPVPDVHAYVALFNDGADDIVVDNRLRLHTNVYLYIFNDKNEVVRYKGWDKRTVAVAPQALSELTTLKPGATLNRDGLFDSIKFPPGTYRMVATYEEGEGWGDSPFAGKFWQGEVRSRVVPIPVIR